MPPDLALLLWFALLVGLFYFDPAKESKVSAALWIPLIWLSFLGSRSPNQWLGGNQSAGGAALLQAWQNGDPLNRAIYIVLLVLAVGILVSRSLRWGEFISRNRALTIYVLFGLLSVAWSAFPEPALRKWVNDLSAYFMALVVVTDTHPIEALGTLLRRLGYLLLPLSIILIKYFPYLAKQYDPWSGAATYSGVTTSKNMLGILCLVCGIYFFWDTVVRWQRRSESRERRVILVNAVMLGMAVWLLNICNSATSRACLAIACIVILAAHSERVRSRPRILIVAIPLIVAAYFLLFFGLGLSLDFAAALGRTSLSGRKLIWQAVLSQRASSLLGAGYSSFWMGPRVERVWKAYGGIINEAHNGYLELYLNLGYIGVALGLLFVAAVYRNICKWFSPFSPVASLALAIWTAFLVHCTTEADFRFGLWWFTFVLAALLVSQVDRDAISSSVASSGAEGHEDFVLPDGESGGATIQPFGPRVLADEPPAQSWEPLARPRRFRRSDYQA